MRIVQFNDMGNRSGTWTTILGGPSMRGGFAAVGPTQVEQLKATMRKLLPVDGAVTDLGDSTSTLQYSSMSFAEINRAGLLTKIATEGASSDDGVPTMRSMPSRNVRRCTT